MNILVFLPYIPYPVDRGTYQRCFHLLRSLAAEHTVDLLAMTENGERMEHAPLFESFCRQVRFVQFEHPSWAKLSNRLLKSTPSSVMHWSNPQTAAALDEMVATGDYDFVHVCDIVLAQYFLRKHEHLPLALDRSRVDLQFQVAHTSVTASSFKSKLFAWEGITKMWAYEKRIAKRVTMEVVCGPDDETFIREHVSQEVPVKVIANGVDLEYFHPEAVSEARAAEPTVLFCGAMDYAPNVDALRWYFGEIHDQLLAQVPDLKVLIVGKSPLPEVLAYASKPNVTVTGGVPDVRPYYRRAWLQIVPLRIGGGTRLKIVESMAIGTPVVSTTIGAQGLGLVHEHDILLADDARTFAAQTARALHDIALRDKIEEQGKHTATTRLAWPMLGRDLCTAYEKAFGKRRANVPAPPAPTSPTRAWTPPISILGVPFDHVTSNDTLALFEAMIQSRRPHYVATANVDFVAQAAHDLELSRILNEAHLVVCDGMPLVWASRLLGNPLPERVAGSDLVPLLLEQAEQRGHRVFFLGGEEKIAAQAVENVRKRYPNLQIAGVLSPSFAPLLEMNHEAIARQIREAQPDILLVSFGCPKQEKWISMHYRSLGVPVCMGVGATIDFLAGAVKRAPVWMQRVGLEWSYRLLQEPRRLFKRYLTDMLAFGMGIVRQLRTLRDAGEVPSGEMMWGSTAGIQTLKLPSHLNVKTVTSHEDVWEALWAQTGPVILNGEQVRHVDSTALAMLIRLAAGLRRREQILFLANASAPLKRGLALLGAGSLVEQCDSIADAVRTAAERACEKLVTASFEKDQSRVINWQGEVTAENASHIWTQTSYLLENTEDMGLRRLKIDLSSVRFVDSTGVGLMVRAKKQCSSRGIAIRFERPSPAALGVIQTMRMESYLFESTPVLSA